MQVTAQCMADIDWKGRSDDCEAHCSTGFVSVDGKREGGNDIELLSFICAQHLT